MPEVPFVSKRARADPKKVSVKKQSDKSSFKMIQYLDIGNRTATSNSRIQKKEFQLISPNY